MSEIRKEFASHELNADGQAKARVIANTMTFALCALEEACGSDGREMSLVRTKLEEAAFFAKRAMALRPENQK